VELYDTRALIGVIRVMKPLTPYWLQYFPRTLTFDSMDIQFDMVADSRVLAPFVAPNVQGRVMAQLGHTAKVFRPAYVKPKHAVDPSQGLPRMAGEALAGEMSAGQRVQAIIVENMRREREMIERRWEWMAAKAIIDGQVTVSGEDYPSVTVSFGRHADLAETLLTTERWSQTTATPLADIAAKRKRSFELARTPITRLTFGADAWEYFSEHADVTALLSNQQRGSTTDFSLVAADPGPFEYMGRLAGSAGIGGLDLYRYSDQYDDDSGTATDVLDTNTVVGTGPGLQGVRCFGAIKDLDAGPNGLAALEMFPKMWTVPDPSTAYTMIQSAPLMVPAQPNGSFKLKVH
jgi:hypothetical protein